MVRYGHAHVRYGHTHLRYGRTHLRYGVSDADPARKKLQSLWGCSEKWSGDSGQAWLMIDCLSPLRLLSPCRHYLEARSEAGYNRRGHANLSSSRNFFHASDQLTQWPRNKAGLMIIMGSIKHASGRIWAHRHHHHHHGQTLALKPWERQDPKHPSLTEKELQTTHQKTRLNVAGNQLQEKCSQKKTTSHPTQKKQKRKSNRHYTSSCCILTTEVSNLCIVYYCKQKLDSQET